ncbi:T9SS type A sorting domain-containing protein, partial [Rhodocaloribacter sp.]
QFALPGPNSDVTTVAINRDDIYVGGFFSAVGSVRANGLARWNRLTKTWHEVGGGLDLSAPEARIQDMAIGDSGELYVTGKFAEPGGAAFLKVAMWDGETWTVLDGDPNAGNATSLLNRNGDLYASSFWRIVEGDTLYGVARWEGTLWSQVGEGLKGGVQDLAFGASGDLYAAGSFLVAGSDTAHGVARWDGEHWSALGGSARFEGWTDAQLYSVVTYRDTVYVGGIFGSTSDGEVQGVARWDGNTWTLLGDDLNGFFIQLAVDTQGRLYAGEGTGALRQWTGETWIDFTPISGEPLGFSVETLVNAGEELFVGGISPVNDVTPPLATHLYWYDGTQWNVMGGTTTNGISGQINVLAADAEYVYAGGQFDFAGLTPVQNAARWDGMQWTPLGTGLDGVVLALALDAAGSLYAGGRFTRSGATEVHHVACWDGTQWQPLGGGVDGPVNALLVAGADLYVAGNFDTATDATKTIPVRNLARWDGAQWHEVGDGVEGTVNSLALGDDDILYVGGSFEEQGGLLTGHGVRAWDGAQWIPLGDDFGGPVWTIVWHDGTLYAGGNFIESLGDPGNGIARWDDQRWQGLGAGTQGPNVDVEAIAFSDRGDLYATGWFAGAGESSAPLVARWDGAQWHALDGGLYGTYGLALAIKEREVYVGGAFFAAAAPLSSGGIPAGNFARWTMPIDLPVEDGGPLPVSVELYRNYPNPFRGQTTISYVLPRPSRVELVVYDVLGRRVATLLNAWQAAGEHTEVFDARKLPGGVYFWRLSTEHRVETRSMMLLR